MKRQIDIGVLYSRSGSYGLLSDACLRGILSAVQRVNRDPGVDVSFRCVMRDPRGVLDSYAPLAESILRDSGARHIFGCVTSSSRKEVIPVLDRMNGSLWYAAPYEGFEASDHVAYLGACPNQHLLPLLDWAGGALGDRVYLTGSNYIWGWEINRLARQVIEAQGGTVMGERYLPVGAEDVSQTVDEIAAMRPDYVLNSLIGASQYRFLHAMARVAPGLPVLSCNLTECELPAIGGAAEGLIAAGPYFRNPASPDDFGSAHEARAHAGVVELARLLHGRPGAETLPLSALIAGDGASGAGDLIAPLTHHTSLPVMIARVSGGAFTVIQRLPAVPGSPYMTGRDATAASALRPNRRSADARLRSARPRSPQLRIVT